MFRWFKIGSALLLLALETDVIRESPKSLLWVRAAGWRHFYTNKRPSKRSWTQKILDHTQTCMQVYIFAWPHRVLASRGLFWHKEQVSLVHIYTQARPHKNWTQTHTRNAAMSWSSTHAAYQLFVHLQSYQQWWLNISLNMQIMLFIMDDVS